LQGGENISKLDNDSLSDPKQVFLPAIGLNFRNYFRNNISLQVGVQFSQRGSNYNAASYKL
jgi:hypothetical protein